MKECEKIVSKLHSLGLKGKLDEGDRTPGEKFHIWELKGVPFRLEVGEQEIKSKSLTLSTRDLEKKEKIKTSELHKLRKLGQNYDRRLLQKADSSLKDKIENCSSKEKIKKSIESGKIARVNFCSVESKGIKCAEKIEKELGAEVRGTLANKNEKPNNPKKCVVCNKEANVVVYIGKSY